MPSEKDGVMIVLSSPSGAGKTTLVKMLSKIDNYEISISHTTRQPRPNEENDKDYYFVNEDEFKRLIKNQLKNTDLKIEFIEGKKFIELSNDEKDFDVIYPSVGDNMSFLKRVIKKNNLVINYLTRDEDKYCWQFSNKGYFNFKSNIPKILSQFKLN